MALLEVNGLKKSFQKQKKKIAAVNGINFYIDQGECLGLVGESGCGKSTTANIIARLIKEDKGTVTFNGVEISNKKYLRPVGKNLQMIFQNPQDSFDPRDTVVEGIMQGAQSYGIYSKRDLKENALKIFDYVGLKKSYADIKISNLSGGECQRAAIGRSIICEPKLLICDEATSSLDVLVQAQIVDLLKKLKNDKKMAMLFITHDIPLAAALCDRIAVMHKGEIVEMKEAKQLLMYPEHQQTHCLIDSVLPFSSNVFSSPNKHETEKKDE